MTLFGIQVVLPEPKLEDGETVTSEHFLKDFKESRFYFELTQNF